MSEPTEIKIKIKDCPKASEGVHNWIYYAAMRLKEAGCPKAEAAKIIRAGMSRPPNPANEVNTTVDAAYDRDHTPGPAWPTLNVLARDKLFSARFTLAELAASSPVQGADLCPAVVLAAMFRPVELVCIGWDKNKFDTRPFSEWTKLEGKQFIVPSPMSKLVGLTQAGRPSKKSNDNTGPRRYQVVEFDAGAVDEHAAVARELGRFAPLVLCVHSGGKSLHSWFKVEGWPEDRQRKFFEYAVSLGADPKMWTGSQFTRMPGGTRQGGIRQVIHYFNPANT